MNKNIIGLVGELAAGKGTVSDYLIKKYSASSFRFSMVLQDILERLHLEVNRQNYQTLSSILRQNFGEDVLAKVIFNDVQNDPHDVIVIDGIRRPDDVKYLKTIPGFKLVFVTADMKIRYERMTKRGEKADDNAKTFEEFIKDHEAEPEQEIKKIGQQADFVINNNGTQEELIAQIDKIIDK